MNWHKATYHETKEETDHIIWGQKEERSRQWRRNFSKIIEGWFWQQTKEDVDDKEGDIVVRY